DETAPVARGHLRLFPFDFIINFDRNILKMKNSTYFLLAFLGVLVFTGCGNSHQSGSAKKIDITPQQLATVLDPVCRMSMEQHAIADTAVYEGKIYGFCNTGCKEAFVAEPSKYLTGL